MADNTTPTIKVVDVPTGITKQLPGEQNIIKQGNILPTFVAPPPPPPKESK